MEHCMRGGVGNYTVSHNFAKEGRGGEGGGGRGGVGVKHTIDRYIITT